MNAKLLAFRHHLKTSSGALQTTAQLAECNRDRQEEAEQINMVEGKLVSRCTECVFLCMRFLDSESCRETKGTTVRLVVKTGCVWVDAGLAAARFHSFWCLWVM